MKNDFEMVLHKFDSAITVIPISEANPFDEVIRPREQKQRMVEYLTPITIWLQSSHILWYQRKAG